VEGEVQYRLIREKYSLNQVEIGERCNALYHEKVFLILLTF